MDQETLQASFKAYFSGLMPGIDWQRLTLPYSVHHITKGDHLFKQGEPAQRLYFLHSGLVRYVNLSEDGKEFTQSFVPAPRMIGSTRAMVTGAAAQFSIQALEDSVVMSYPWAEFFKLYESDVGFLKGYVHFLEQIFIREQDLKKRLERDSAEKRYLDFCAEHADIIDKIPLQQVASYIGITPVALSRIRGKLRGR